MTLAERLRDEPDYRPHCLACSTMARMKRTATGFICDPDFTEPPLFIKGHMLFGRTGCGHAFDVEPVNSEAPQ